MTESVGDALRELERWWHEDWPTERARLQADGEDAALTCNVHVSRPLDIDPMEGVLPMEGVEDS